MNHRTQILPGVYLTAVQSDKFKTGCFSLNLLRPMKKEEAAANALIPSVLLRGSVQHPDIASISAKLDELYGASIGTLIRKKGEVQLVGFYCDYVQDEYVQEPVFAPLMEFLSELLFSPRLENGAFPAGVVESEKQNLLNAMLARINDKRSYANSQMLRTMCAGQPYGVPRIGEPEDLDEITPQSLYAHYRQILGTSRVEMFYMGSLAPEQVTEVLRQTLQTLPRAGQVRSGRNDARARGKTGAGEDGAAGRDAGQAEPRLFHRHYGKRPALSGAGACGDGLRRRRDEQALYQRARADVSLLLRECVV